MLSMNGWHCDRIEWGDDSVDFDVDGVGYFVFDDDGVGQVFIGCYVLADVLFYVGSGCSDFC